LYQSSGLLLVTALIQIFFDIWKYDKIRLSFRLGVNLIPNNIRYTFS